MVWLAPQRAPLKLVVRGNHDAVYRETTTKATASGGGRARAGAARGSGGAADHVADRLSSAGLARLPRSGAYYASSREVLISLAVPRGAAVDGDGEETRASGTPSSDGVPQSSSPSASAGAAAVAVAAAEDDDDDETLVSLLLLPFSRKSTSHARPLPRADVVLSHIPPLGVLDRALTGAHIGCGRLRSRFAAWAAPPRLWCFGHVHESYGAERTVLRKPSKGATDGSGGGGDGRAEARDAATDPPTAGGRAADAATSWAPSTALCLKARTRTTAWRSACSTTALPWSRG